MEPLWAVEDTPAVGEARDSELVDAVRPFSIGRWTGEGEFCVGIFPGVDGMPNALQL